MAGEYKTWSTLAFQPVREVILPHALLPYLREHSRILDAGCNQGATALFLAQLGHSVHGIDINTDALDTAIRRAHGLDLSTVLHFEVADLLDLDTDARFDVVIMVRFLTCLTDEEDWRKAISKAGAMLADGGLLYVNDFLCTPESEDYRSRYAYGAGLGWRSGNFAVNDADGTLRFVAHHHSADDLAELSAGYQTEMFQSYPSVSMHGNSVTVFELILRKRNGPA